MGTKNMDELKAGYMSVPPFTRYFMTSVFLLSFGMTYKMIDPYSLLLMFDKLWRFQLWRLITPYLFVGPFSQSFLFAMISMYMFLRRIEDLHQHKYLTSLCWSYS